MINIKKFFAFYVFFKPKQTKTNSFFFSLLLLLSLVLKIEESLNSHVYVDLLATGTKKKQIGYPEYKKKKKVSKKKRIEKLF